MTDADYDAWLASPSARRTLLVEAGVNSGGSEITRYLSSHPFISASTDTPASTSYEPRIAGGAVVAETLGLTAGSATLSGGDVELHNDDGSLDAWLLDSWERRPISVYFGDASWPKSDFRLVYAGTIAGVPDSSAPERLTIRVADKMQRLTGAVSEATVGGAGPNAALLLPVCLGECHNVTPVLTNESTLEYAVHSGPIESIIEVRDAGVPVAFTPSLSTGRFTLSVTPVGAITASVQGDKPAGGTYYNDVANLVQRLVTGYGRSDLRLSAPDLDSTSLAAFAAAHTQPVGIYMTSTTSVLEACEALASSIGAKPVLSRSGLLRLVQVALPQSSATKAIAEGSDFELGSLRIAARTEAAAAVRLGFCRNWTVQTVQAGVLPQHQKLYAQEWLTATATDSTAAALHKLSLDAEQQNSLLLRGVDASAEASRLLALRSTPRAIYEFLGYAPLATLELGVGVTLTAARFGLTGATIGQVVSLEIDWLSGRVRVGVLL